MKALSVILLSLLCSLSATADGAQEKLREVPVKEALARRFPEETALITFQKDGRPGITVIGNNTFQGTIVLKKTDPARDAIAQAGEYVVAYPGGDMEKEVAYCLAHKGKLEDALKELKLKTSPARRVAAPLLDKCIINYECRVWKKVDLGDSTLFGGRIVSVNRMKQTVGRLFITGYDKGKPIFKAFEGARGLPTPQGREKYPEQTVLIVSCGKDGKPNAMTAGWTMLVSDDPPMIAVAIGKSRYTHGLISSVKQFVYVYPGADMEHEVMYCGTKSGRRQDKFEALKLQTQPATKVKPPLLSKCLAAFECTVAREVDDGSHTIFVGRIEAAHVSDKRVPRLYNLGRSRRQAVLKGLEAADKPAPKAPSTKPATPTR